MFSDNIFEKTEKYLSELGSNKTQCLLLLEMAGTHPCPLSLIFEEEISSLFLEAFHNLGLVVEFRRFVPSSKGANGGRDL